MKDLEEIAKATRKNREYLSKQKMPVYKNELKYLIINNKQSEMEETKKMLEGAKHNKV